VSTTSNRALPFSREQLQSIVQDHPTPFHIYDEAGIRRTARELNNAFGWVPGGYRNYYAVKALPNPAVMKIVQEEGMGFDCSSLPELLLAHRLNTPGDQIGRAHV
jgi:diaminopimelate decarboxylase